MPEIVAEIRDWDDGERMSYVYSWLRMEERLEGIESAAPSMTLDQRRRHGRLERLIRGNEEHAALLRSLAG